MKKLFFIILFILSVKLSNSQYLFEDRFWNNDSTYQITYKTDIEMPEISVFETYYKNGQKRSISSELNGIIHGVSIEYYENGKLKSLECYNYGVEVGTWMSFYSNGTPKRISEYGFKIEELYLPVTYDTTVIFNSYGNDTIIANNAIKKPYKSTEFYPNGKLKAEEHYINLKRTGVWRYYNESGILKREEIYRDDMIINKTEF